MRYRVKPWFALSLLPLLLLMPAAAAPAAAERCPCDLLLLPYFEVELAGPGHEDVFVQKTTSFAVGNYAAVGVPIELTIWTNWGIPVHRSVADLAGKAVLTVNLRDWLVFGHFPEGDLEPDELAHLQAVLAGAPSPRDGLYYAGAVADRTLTGYVTARSIAPAAERGLLWGDFFMLHEEADLAAGESLVRLAGEEPRELCDRHLIRFLDGGPFQGGTRFVFWTGEPGYPSAEPLPAAPGVPIHCEVFDEAGARLGVQDFTLHATQAVDIARFAWPVPFGWVDCRTGSPSFLCEAHSARDQDDLALRSFCIPEGMDGGGQVHPHLALEKYVEGEEADLPPGPAVPAGEEVGWTYVVTNTGAMLLQDVTVTDDQGLEVTCPKTTLWAGEAMTCSAHGPVPPGPYRNVATVRGHSEDNQRLEVTDPAHCFGADSGLALEKYVEGEDADVAPGPFVGLETPVHWTYVVTNSGNVALTAVTVTDDRGVSVSCPKTALEVGETMTCTAQGLVTPGQYRNLGTVVGVAPDGSRPAASDPAHCFGMLPGIDIQKATDGFDADLPPGPTVVSCGAECPPPCEPQVVVWTYVVANTGNVPLTGVSVTDDRGVAVTCPATALVPGQSMTCTAQGTVPLGQYANVGTATGTGPTGGVVTASDPSHCFGALPVPPQGCTPGYWKNHTGSWPPTGYATAQTVGSVFAVPAVWPDLATATLKQALGFGGGAGAHGAAEVLLRAAVAALLNANHPDVNYPREPAALLADVNAALATQNRDTLLALAAVLDADNNLGCPLS